ncbi:MAG TPA: hypothetical protein ENI23_04255 [bacterium]|nr:hypothetical protein [bacterium]
MKTPIVVVNMAFGDHTFNFNKHIGRFMGIWANYMALPFIEGLKQQADVHEGTILEFFELEDND